MNIEFHRLLLFRRLPEFWSFLGAPLSELFVSHNDFEPGVDGNRVVFSPVDAALFLEGDEKSEVVACVDPICAALDVPNREPLDVVFTVWGVKYACCTLCCEAEF